MNKIATILRESKTARFLIPIGIFFIVFGIITFVLTQKAKNYLPTDSTITKVEIYEEASTDTEGNRTEATYSVTVKYTVDGKDYESVLVGVSKQKEGDKMKIYYDPSDPSQITQSKSPIIPLIIIVAGVAALIGGIVSLVNAVNKYKRMNEQEQEWTNA